VRAVSVRGALSLPVEIENDEDGGWFDVWSSHLGSDDSVVVHRVLGYGRNDTESIEDDQEVLFAVESDQDHGMCWGDAGGLYFVLDPKDLAAHAWSKVRVTSTD
jgi:uncharacterized protein YwqG